MENNSKNPPLLLPPKESSINYSATAKYYPSLSFLSHYIFSLLTNIPFPPKWGHLEKKKFLTDVNIYREIIKSLHKENYQNSFYIHLHIFHIWVKIQ